MGARPLSLRAVLTSTIVAAGLVAGTPVWPAAAFSTYQSYWVPVDKQVMVHGHGYGHGHGMSQFGAEGAALQGKSYKDILGFYYPGTQWSNVRGLVRVLITEDTTSDVLVSPAPGLTLRDLGNGTTYALPGIAGVKRWRINVDNGKSVIGYLTDRWHRWKPGGKPTLVGDGEFSANGPLTLWTPSGPRTYRGALLSASPSKGATYRDTVNVLSLDDYVKGVVPAEMPASWSPEAVKAQAVAARTYATWSRNQYLHRYYQICDTSSCQVYGGVGAEDPRSNAAVNDTSRQILTYGGRPAFTQFSSSSGGWTAAGGMPYLPAKKDPYDGWAGNPVHDWSLRIDAGLLERAYPSLGSLRRILVVNRDGNGQWHGRVNSLVLDGTKNDVTISGDSFQWAFGLRSDWFTVEPTPIIMRWTRLGGVKSPLGPVKSGEFPVDNGSAQSFDHGRIFYSNSTGAHELYGRVFAGYRHLGGPASVLGLPMTGVQGRKDGFRTKFQGGVIYSRPATGTVPVLGSIATRYMKEGGVYSDLGWPTETNFAVTGGERVNFEHGYITWSRKAGTTQVHVTG